jgi:hypothetical protein
MPHARWYGKPIIFLAYLGDQQTARRDTMNKFMGSGGSSLTLRHLKSFHTISAVDSDRFCDKIVYARVLKATTYYPSKSSRNIRFLLLFATVLLCFANNFPTRSG